MPRDLCSERRNPFNKFVAPCLPPSRKELGSERDYDLWAQIDFGHLLQCHCITTALATPVDHEQIGVSTIVIAKSGLQPHRITNRAERLVGHNDAHVRHIQTPPVGWPRKPWHIDYDIMELCA